MHIRQEQTKDHLNVYQLIKAAFADVEMSDKTEHLLVERLRQSDAFIPELSLVAEWQEKLIGHIILTKIKIVGERTSFYSLALAPVSVLPAHQGKGIGGNLIKTAHRIAKELGHESVILIGHPNYYPRFGYKQLDTLGITLPFDAPLEACMAIELTENALKEVTGELQYPKEFFA